MKMILRMGGCYFRQPLPRTDSTGILWKLFIATLFLWGWCSEMCALHPLAYGQVCAQRREALLNSKIFIWDDIKLKNEKTGQNLAFTLRRSLPESQLCFLQERWLSELRAQTARCPRRVQTGTRFWNGVPGLSVPLWEEIFFLVQVQSPSQNYNELPPQTPCRSAQQVIGWNCNSNSSHLCFALNVITYIYLWASNCLL